MSQSTPNISNPGAVNTSYSGASITGSAEPASSVFTTDFNEEHTMNGNSLMDIGIYIGIALIALITIAVIVTRLYQRASKELSFVRTGVGGQRVIKDGGAIVLPVLHEIIPVNMNTLRLAVRRDQDQALITHDRMRVDVVAEFYVRVQPTDESISNAAQTLGMKTVNPDQLKELVEGKFVDALRSVAAEMSMEELHEKRVDFVQKVQQVVSEDLLKNGLELETVSLTGLDQTSMDYFNPNNAFDAEGLTRLTEEIETRRKIRNDIEQDTAVQIKSKNLETEKQKLELDRETEYARLSQQREIEIRRAQQEAEIKSEQASKQKEAQQAEIVASQEVEKSRILADKQVEEESIRKLKAVEIASQEKDIAIAEKSKDRSLANAEADLALAQAVEAEEKVSTAREKEIAERRKQIELIKAAQEADREAIGVTVAAQAEKDAAVDRADAIRELANADADKQRIAAQAESDAEKLLSEAAEIRFKVDAAGHQLLNEAANVLSDQQIGMKVKLELIQNLQDIIRESAKPMENIDDIKIIQVAGLDGVSTGEVSNHQAGNLSDQMVNSALKYRAQAPLLDSLLNEIGIKGGDINGFTQGVEPAAENRSDEPDIE